MKRRLSFLLSLLMLLTCAIPAFATDVMTTDVILHKLSYEDVIEPIENTGSELGEAALNGAKPWNPETQGAVTFTGYTLSETVVNAAKKANPDVDHVHLAKALAEGELTDGVAVDVDADGLATFESLPNGYYLFVETDAPANAEIANPILVELPFTNDAGDGYLEAVHVYPKNEFTPLEIGFTKQLHRTAAADSIPLAGVTFQLFSGDPGSGTVINFDSSLVTDVNGAITGITGLVVGDYYLVETSLPEVAEGSTDPAILLNRYMANTAENRLTFTYTEDGEITFPEGSLLTGMIDETTPGVTPDVINYDAPTVEKEVEGGPFFTALDPINYTLTSVIPRDIADYTTYNLTDSWDAGLAVDIDTVVVSVGDTPLVAGTHYTLSQTDNAFTLTFVPAMIDDYATSNLTVEYTGNITTNAVADTNLTNTVTLDYNNGRVEGSDTDDANVRTGSIEVIKVDDGLWGTGALDTPLEGAEFILFRTVGDVTEYYQEDNSWGPEESATRLVSNADGKIVISGLGDGDYTFREVKAPENYNLPLGEDAETTFTIANGASNLEPITNTRSIDAPVTGLEKAVLVFGGLVILMTVAIVLGRRRQEV